jgi:hypothetical protein
MSTSTTTTLVPAAPGFDLFIVAVDNGDHDGSKPTVVAEKFPIVAWRVEEDKQGRTWLTPACLWHKSFVDGIDRAHGDNESAVRLPDGRVAGAEGAYDNMGAWREAVDERLLSAPHLRVVDAA